MFIDKVSFSSNTKAIIKINHRRLSRKFFYYMPDKIINYEIEKPAISLIFYYKTNLVLPFIKKKKYL